MSIDFVQYQPEHLEQIIELHRSAKVGFEVGMSDKDEEVDLMAIEKIYLQNGGEFLVGLLDGEVMAMGGFQRLSADSAELRRMRIRRDLQNQGYGSQLLKELERLASQSGISTFRFETARVRPLTLEFYRKHGYEETGRGFYGKVETVHFHKSIE